MCWRLLSVLLYILISREDCVLQIIYICSGLEYLLVTIFYNILQQLERNTKYSDVTFIYTTIFH